MAREWAHTASYGSDQSAELAATALFPMPSPFTATSVYRTAATATFFVWTFCGPTTAVYMESVTPCRCQLLGCVCVCQDPARARAHSVRDRWHVKHTAKGPTKSTRVKSQKQLLVVGAAVDHRVRLRRGLWPVTLLIVQVRSNSCGHILCTESCLWQCYAS